MPFNGLSETLLSMGWSNQVQESCSARFDFLIQYFQEIAPGHLWAVPKGSIDNPYFGRYGLCINSHIQNQVFMTGLIHHPLDTKAEETALDEAFTYQQDYNNKYPELSRPIFRFFTASNNIRFFLGSMETRRWEFDREFDPVDDAKGVYDYLEVAAMSDELWEQPQGQMAYQSPYQCPYPSHGNNYQPHDPVNQQYPNASDNHPGVTNQNHNTVSMQPEVPGPQPHTYQPHQNGSNPN